MRWGAIVIGAREVLTEVLAVHPYLKTMSTKLFWRGIADCPLLSISGALQLV